MVLRLTSMTKILNLRKINRHCWLLWFSIIFFLSFCFQFPIVIKKLFLINFSNTQLCLSKFYQFPENNLKYFNVSHLKKKSIFSLSSQLYRYQPANMLRNNKNQVWRQVFLYIIFFGKLKKCKFFNR